MTDSFHGTAFSIIFKKPFSSIYNTHRGADRFKNLLGSLGFGDSRRLHETDDADKIRENPNVSFAIDFTKADRHIETERQMSLRWLKAALSPQSAAGGDFLGSIREKVQALRPAKDNLAQGRSGHVETPSFEANNAAWKIASRKNVTELTVAPSAAIRGNLVWCDLPFPLRKQAAYRLTIKWAPRTSGRAVNLHVRNEETGKFRVIGTVPVSAKGSQLRTDTVDFVMPEDDFTQFMLGAVHFSGEGAGADVASLSVQEIPASAVKTAKKAPGHAEVATDLALKDNQRFIDAYAHGVASRSIISARARLMFHSHAIEKGLSRSDFRGGFGKIAVPALAKEMNSWLAAGRDLEDQFFKSAASVMHSYFDRHARLNVNVIEFRELFDAAILELIARAEPHHGGVLSAGSTREAKVDSPADRSFLDVVYGRRSVREFTSKPVTNDEIQRAVQIAMQAPSVCNRQAARVHQFEDAGAIRAALELQGGFGGYKMPPKLLLVTSDLTAFLFAAERNQAFVDGGLFMMTLLLGLQQVGLGSCCLNTAMGTERETAIRKILGIPETEVFISFIAVGHFDPAILTPQSKRMPVENVLVRHAG
jgi:nitroreductase